jgi:hypothetical protein
LPPGGWSSIRSRVFPTLICKSLVRSSAANDAVFLSRSQPLLPVLDHFISSFAQKVGRKRSHVWCSVNCCVAYYFALQQSTKSHFLGSVRGPPKSGKSSKCCHAKCSLMEDESVRDGNDLAMTKIEVGVRMSPQFRMNKSPMPTAHFSNPFLIQNIGRLGPANYCSCIIVDTFKTLSVFWTLIAPGRIDSMRTNRYRFGRETNKLNLGACGPLIMKLAESCRFSFGRMSGGTGIN